MSEILTPIKTFNNHPLVDTFSREQIESINKNMLTGEDLSCAVNNALEQAKQTGMFDGEDGVGIETVIVPRSPNENGELDISFKLTDGQIHTFTVKYGKDGKDGNGIASAVLNADYTLTLTFTDGTKYTTPSIRGAAGAAGSDGKDGTSVTVKSVSESSADGGSNVVTFSDGKTVTIKNGSKGSDGAAGKDGKDGSDATVTAANIKSALGYTPANATTVSQLSEAIGDNQEQLSQLSAELDELAGTLPDYWKTHCDTRIVDIRSALASAGWNKSAFLWYHDTHYTNSYKKSPMLLKYLQDHTPINAVNFGGDVVASESDFSYLWEWRNAVRDLRNHHSVPGNHDDGNEVDNRFDDNYIYAYLLAAEETPQVVRGDALYYYIDNPAEKTRYLYLDTATKDGNILNDATEQQWLKDTLVSTPDGWHIVAIAHIWRTVDYDQSPPVDAGWSMGGALCITEFEAYNLREGIYADCGGTVEFCIGGHTHVDADFLTERVHIPVILTECDARDVRSGLTATEGTITEASVNAIIADYTNKQINVIRIGRGSSRTVAINHVVPPKYTNVLTIATDKDGSLYNGGKGYKENTRWSASSNAETAATGWDITGYIKCKTGDTLRFKNMSFIDPSASTHRECIYYFDASYGFVTNSTTLSSVSAMSAFAPVVDESGEVVQITIPTSMGGFDKIRIVVNDINENSIITVNEEIT